jgi:hypothetical protein
MAFTFFPQIPLEYRLLVKERLVPYLTGKSVKELEEIEAYDSSYYISSAWGCRTAQTSMVIATSALVGVSIHPGIQFNVGDLTGRTDVDIALAVTLIALVIPCIVGNVAHVCVAKGRQFKDTPDSIDPLPPPHRSEMDHEEEDDLPLRKNKVLHSIKPPLSSHDNATDHGETLEGKKQPKEELTVESASPTSSKP